MPYLAFLVSYGLEPAAPEPTVPGKIGNQKSGWRSQLSEADIPLFNALRDWRLERARRERIPPYVVCTNRQLAAMIKARPQSVSKLGAIDGVGKAKLEKYGQELLAILARPRNKPGSERTPAEDSPEFIPTEPFESNGGRGT